MKKLAIAAAISAAFSTGAYAITPTPQIVTLGSDITATCPAPTTAFSITTPILTPDVIVQMNGDICLLPTGPGGLFVRLGFHTVTGKYSSSAPAGTTFDMGGSIQIDIQTTNGYQPYGTVVVSTTPLDCTDATGITGLQAPGGVIGVPGPFPPPPPNLAVCDTTLFTLSSQLYIQ